MSDIDFAAVCSYLWTENLPKKKKKIKNIGNILIITYRDYNISSVPGKKKAQVNFEYSFQ